MSEALNSTDDILLPARRLRDAITEMFNRLGEGIVAARARAKSGDVIVIEASQALERSSLFIDVTVVKGQLIEIPDGCSVVRFYKD